MTGTRNPDRRSRTIISTRRITSTDTATAKINYLVQILEDEIELYAPQFKKTEKPKIVAILGYYGFTYGEDYDYRLFYNDWGNRVFEITWYFDPTFHDGTWNEMNRMEDWSNLYTYSSITY